jgi:hypothetical protein
VLSIPPAAGVRPQPRPGRGRFRSTVQGSNPPFGTIIPFVFSTSYKSVEGEIQQTPDESFGLQEMSAATCRTTESTIEARTVGNHCSGLSLPVL